MLPEKVTRPGRDLCGIPEPGGPWRPGRKDHRPFSQVCKHHFSEGNTLPLPETSPEISRENGEKENPLEFRRFWNWKPWFLGAMSMLVSGRESPCFAWTFQDVYTKREPYLNLSVLRLLRLLNQLLLTDVVGWASMKPSFADQLRVFILLIACWIYLDSIVFRGYTVLGYKVGPTFCTWSPFLEWNSGVVSSLYETIHKQKKD